MLVSTSLSDATSVRLCCAWRRGLLGSASSVFASAVITYCPAVPVCRISTPYRFLLWTLCRMLDKYRHCNCRLIALLVASDEAILTSRYGFVRSLFSQCYIIVICTYVYMSELWLPVSNVPSHLRTYCHTTIDNCLKVGLEQ